jgi:steroid delta-isomerase-like uncharacterized protein
MLIMGAVHLFLQGAAMTSDEIRSFLDRFVYAWEHHDVATLSACYTEDCVVVSPIFSTIKGKTKVEKSYGDLFLAFANPSITVEDTIVSAADPARAVIVWTVKSIHAGNIFGMPGSGKSIERTIAFFFTFRDGLIAKEHRVYDFTSMLMQLGVLKAKPN